MGSTIIVAQSCAGLTLSAMVWALRAMQADRRRHAAGSGLMLSGEPAIGSFWPGPGFPGGLRKLTLAGTAIWPKVIFLAPPRTHTGGQNR